MLQRRLARLARRLRIASALDGALAGLTIGLAAAVLALGIARLLPYPHAVAVTLGAVGAGLLGGAIAGGWRRVTPLQAAISADLAAGSEEVISTACELPPDNRFSSGTVQRAERLLQELPDGKLLPRHRVATPWAAGALAVALVALSFAPSLGWSKAKGDDPAAIHPKILEAIERSARDVKKVGDQTDHPELHSLGQEMQRLAASAKLGEVTKKEALAKIAALSERAEQIRKEMQDRKDALAKLEKTPETQGLADAIAQGDAHAARMKAAEIAKKLESGALSEGQKKSLGDALEKIGKDSEGALGEAAREASEALAGGDSKAFEGKMSRLADRMKGSRGKGGPTSDGQSPSGEPSAAGEEELEGAMDDLSKAEDDLSGEGDEMADGGGEGGEQGKKEFCDDCGRREKSEGG